MTKIQIGDKEVRAEICHNLAVVKLKGYRVRHIEKGDWLGVDRVFESKEQAIRFAWAIQERLKFGVKDKNEFAVANGGLTKEQWCAIADEEFERSRI